MSDPTDPNSLDWETLDPTPEDESPAPHPCSPKAPHKCKCPVGCGFVFRGIDTDLTPEHTRQLDEGNATSPPVRCPGSEQPQGRYSRKGQPQPKSDRETTRAILDFAMLLLSRRAYLSDFQRAINTRFKNKLKRPLSQRRIRQIIRKAKEGLAAARGKTKQDYMNESEDFWESIVRDWTVPMRDRMFAQQQLERRQGISKDNELTIKGDRNAPLAVEVVEIVVASRKEAQEVLAAIPNPLLPGIKVGDAQAVPTADHQAAK